MPFGWALLLVALTSYRLTRLVVHDTFPPVRWVRVKLAGDADAYAPRASWSPEWLADLVSCHWCSSVWVAGGVVLVTDVWVGLPWPLLVWGAAATAAAWLCHLEDYFTR